MVCVMHSLPAIVYRQGPLLAAAFCLLGCGVSNPPPAARTWHDLLDELVEFDKWARLDQPGSKMIASSDPSGGNADYNNYVREGPDGWEVFADLEGPGYISRFWFTGGEDGQRFRFVFDDEKTPRIDTTAGAFCGGEDPFLPPLAMKEPFCWFSLVPLPYQKRVVVLSKKRVPKPGGGGWPRHFYQINYTKLAKSQSVESFPRVLSDRDLAKLAEIRRIWVQRAAGPGVPSHGGGMQIDAGQYGDVLTLTGPSMLRELSLSLTFHPDTNPAIREQALRGVRLQIWWNDNPAPSVDVPIGDFFGSVWRTTRFSSLWFGADQRGFISRFPMPFSSRARIGVLNEANVGVGVECGVREAPLPPSESWGYFHAVWNRTVPGQVGSPHPVLSTSGRGKFVGCLLAVTGLDQSWWILESDETMTIDGAKEPQWKGTGLEDYFNGGWYYQNAHTQPLHGLLFKAPFRTVQYRFHFMDPVQFGKSFRMEFERGPGQRSKGWMESVGYYYLEEPVAVAAVSTEDRSMPEDPQAGRTLMQELHNLERLGDGRAAMDAIDTYLQRNPVVPFADVLHLRKWAYREHQGHVDQAVVAYRRIAGSATNATVKKQAEDLAWFHESRNNSLLSLYCRNETRIILDGRPLVIVGHPAKVVVVRVQLEPGNHALVLQAKPERYPDWVLAHLRTHYGTVLTHPNWRISYTYDGSWQRPGYDDSGWSVVGGHGIKGPPEVPFVYIEPNAYAFTISEADGLRARPGVRQEGKSFVVRHEFYLNGDSELHGAGL